MAGHEQSQTTCSDIQAGKVHNSISQLVELTTNNIAYSPAVGVAEDAALVCCGRLSTDRLGIVCFWLSLVWDIQFLGSQLLFVSLILKLSFCFSQLSIGLESSYTLGSYNVWRAILQKIKTANDT